MNTIRAQIRKVQQLENAAADKAGMRFRLMNRSALLGDAKGAGAYIKKLIAQIERDVAPETVQAAKLGVELQGEVLG